MRKSSQFLLALLLAASLVSWPVVTSAQTPSTDPPSQQQTQQQSQTQTQPQQTPSQSPSPIPISQPTPPPPPPQDKTAPAPAASPQPATANTPADQPKTVHPKNSKEDVDAIGNRSVGKGMNFYSLEREIALG